MSNDPQDALLPASPEELKLRHDCSALIVLGNAVIVFSIWNVIKTVMSFFYMDKEVHERLFGQLTQDEVRIVMGIVFALAGLTFLLRLFIGRTAKAEAAGRRQSPAYLVLTFVLLIEHLLFFYFDITELKLDWTILSTISDILINVTSAGILLGLLYFAARVRRLKQQVKEA